jgi:hypothetical protein
MMRLNRSGQLWQSLLIALLPAATVLALIALLFGVGPKNFLPYWSDEVVYWNEAAIFAHAGFDGGYTVYQEQPARAAFTHFGVHGPVFAVIHGSLARVFGWRPYSAFIVNLLVVSVAALIWARCAPAGRSPVGALLVATFWPLLLFLPTNMQEPTHFALAFLFALAIDRYLQGNAFTHAWTALVFVAAVFIRPTWALMALPLGWPEARRHGLRGLVALAGFSLLAMAVAWAAFLYIASPYPTNAQNLTQAWLTSPSDAFMQLIATARRNVKHFLAFSEEAPPTILRYFMLVFACTLIVSWFKGQWHAMNVERLEVSLLALLPILVLMLAAGDWGGYSDLRVLAPHLFVALLILAAHAGWERWLWAGTLVFLPDYYTGFLDLHRAHFTSDHAPLVAMHDVSAPAMPFMAGAPPWTNTVSMHADLLQFPLLGLPPGIGVSYVSDWSSVKMRARSKYFLLRPDEERQLATSVRLAKVAITSLGTIFRNDGPVLAAAGAR